MGLGSSLICFSRASIAANMLCAARAPISAHIPPRSRRFPSLRQSRPSSFHIFRFPRQSFALPARRFATAPPGNSSSLEAGERMPLSLFHKIADRTLEEYQEEMNKMQDVVEDLDMEYGMGVLTVRMGAKGTYVINKQTPARQIWLSSPISGPKRYHYANDKRQWCNTRDGHALTDILSDELTKLSGVKLRLKDPEV